MCIRDRYYITSKRGGKVGLQASGLRRVSGRQFSKSVSGVQNWSVRLASGRPSAGQSRSPGFKVGQPLPSGKNAFGTAGAISTRRVDSFRAKLPPCFLTRTILTRAVRDPPRVWASTTDFFEEKGSGVLNPTPNYRSRPLPLRLKTVSAQASIATCGQRRPKNL